MNAITLVSPGKVRVSAAGVASFNRSWPGSTLRSTRAYWFEFEPGGDLVDTDLPEHDDGPAATVLCNDCREWLINGTRPEWVP